ncbi:hypothetical protein NECAME_10661 [Necator americanus]|uniref:Transmembrane protein n=1 Tax=Necator americanus TaxID=51031 RepID=W2T9S3_NECAM|nr:hypothetical protein NECAME_10661 [Necator americanus]ETN77961.1 hypothetical protein NECAME_10661 [Necator americanus]
MSTTERKAHPTPKLETPSVSSRRPIRDWSLKRSALARRRLEERGVAVFKHRRRTYLTCFGAVHVKVVACFTGFNVLVGVCCALFYCVITSQEQRRPNLKLWLIPLAPVVGDLWKRFMSGEMVLSLVPIKNPNGQQ